MNTVVHFGTTKRLRSMIVRGYAVAGVNEPDRLTISTQSGNEMHNLRMTKKQALQLVQAICKELE